jgi:type IV secretory pathway VirB2 component (pilin)
MTENIDFHQENISTANEAAGINGFLQTVMQGKYHKFFYFAGIGLLCVNIILLVITGYSNLLSALPVLESILSAIGGIGFVFGAGSFLYGISKDLDNQLKGKEQIKKVYDMITMGGLSKILAVSGIIIDVIKMVLFPKKDQDESFTLLIGASTSFLWSNIADSILSIGNRTSSAKLYKLEKIDKYYDNAVKYDQIMNESKEKETKTVSKEKTNIPLMEKIKEYRSGLLYAPEILISFITNLLITFKFNGKKPITVGSISELIIKSIVSAGGFLLFTFVGMGVAKNKEKSQMNDLAESNKDKVQYFNNIKNETTSLINKTPDSILSDAELYEAKIKYHAYNGAYMRAIINYQEQNNNNEIKSILDTNNITKKSIVNEPIKTSIYNEVVEKVNKKSKDISVDKNDLEQFYKQYKNHYDNKYRNSCSTTRNAILVLNTVSPYISKIIETDNELAKPNYREVVLQKELPEYIYTI